MSDDSAPTVERRTPDEAFSLLGTELRVDIVRALSEADGPCSFSELRERVGERDSGKFNYHLGKLVGSFVRRDDDGYDLTFAGKRVAGAMLAGTYTTDVTLDPIEVDERCPECGGTILARYEDESVHVACADCEKWRNEFTFPPATVEQFDREELPAAFDRWLRTTFGRIVAGFCSNCAGRMTGELERSDDEDEDVRIHYRCQRCGSEAVGSTFLVLLFHPVGISFFYDHGIDVTTEPTWRLPGQGAFETDVHTENPLTARVTVSIDDEVLDAILDENVQVESVERRPA